MMQGDQYMQPIAIKKKSGEPLTDQELDDMEVMIGSVRKTLSSGTVTFDSENQVFLVRLTQAETFRMNGAEDVIARVKFLTGDVIGIRVGKIDWAASKSKVVL